MEGIIVPKEFRSQWCNTWSLATHDWVLVIGFGNKIGTNAFHRCNLCGAEQEVKLKLSDESIMAIKWSE